MGIRFKVPPLFSERGVRFLFRDLNQDTCTDLILDIRPSKMPQQRPFPLTPFRSWSLGEATASVTARGKSPRELQSSLATCSVQQARSLNRRDGDRVPLIVLDELFFDPTPERWWKVDHRDEAWLLLRTFPETTIYAWAQFSNYLSHRMPNMYAEPRLRPMSTGLPLSAVDGRLTKDTADVNTEPGLWVLEHALLPAGEFINKFVLHPKATGAARKIVAATATLASPTAHTGLVQSPKDWIDILISQFQWKHDEASDAARRLFVAIGDSGLRPLTGKPPPVVPAETKIDKLAKLAGAAFLDAPLIQYFVHHASVNTIAGLAKRRPCDLARLAPVFPADIRAISRTLTVLGHECTRTRVHPRGARSFRRISGSGEFRPASLDPEVGALHSLS